MSIQKLQSAEQSILTALRSARELADTIGQSIPTETLALSASLAGAAARLADGRTAVHVALLGAVDVATAGLDDFLAELAPLLPPPAPIGLPAPQTNGASPTPDWMDNGVSAAPETSQTPPKGKGRGKGKFAAA